MKKAEQEDSLSSSVDFVKKLLILLLASLALSGCAASASQEEYLRLWVYQQGKTGSSPVHEVLYRCHSCSLARTLDKRFVVAKRGVQPFFDDAVCRGRYLVMRGYFAHHHYQGRLPYCSGPRRALLEEALPGISEQVFFPEKKT